MGRSNGRRGGGNKGEVGEQTAAVPATTATQPPAPESDVPVDGKKKTKRAKRGKSNTDNAEDAAHQSSPTNGSLQPAGGTPAEKRGKKAASKASSPVKADLSSAAAAVDAPADTAKAGDLSAAPAKKKGRAGKKAAAKVAAPPATLQDRFAAFCAAQDKQHTTDENIAKACAILPESFDEKDIRFMLTDCADCDEFLEKYAKVAPETAGKFNVRQELVALIEKFTADPSSAADFAAVPAPAAPAAAAVDAPADTAKAGDRSAAPAKNKADMSKADTTAGDLSAVDSDAVALASVAVPPAAASAGPLYPRPAALAQQRMHARADPNNDSGEVSKLRARLQFAAGPGGNAAERLELAQAITRARYPLDADGQAKRRADKEGAFHAEYGAVEGAHKWDHERRTRAVEAAHEVEHERVRAPPVVLEKKGEDMTDAEAIAARDKLVAGFQALLKDVERMKHQKEHWQAELQSMFAQEAAEDQRARELFKDVMTSEAFFLGDRQFREWMATREDSKAGVGREGITRWFDDDHLISATPYVGMIPYPRHLSEQGRAEFAKTVNEVFAELRQEADVGTAGFRVECHPVQPHHDDDSDDATQPLEAALSAGVSREPCHSGADVLRVIDESTTLRSFLDVIPCIFVSPVANFPGARADRSGTSFRVTAFVAGGDIVAIEPLSADDCDAFKTHQDATDAAAVQSRVARAVAETFGRAIRPHLAKRTYVAAFRVVNTGASGDDRFAVSLLNVEAFEPRDYVLFKWPDVVGLIAMTLNNARRMETTAEAHARDSATFDAAAAAARVQVRGPVVAAVSGASPVQAAPSPPTKPTTEPTLAQNAAVAPAAALPAPAVLQPPAALVNTKSSDATAVATTNGGSSKLLYAAAGITAAAAIGVALLRGGKASS